MRTDWPLATSALKDDVQAVGSIAAVDTILEVVCRTTGMGFAAIARVTEDRWIACQVRDEITFGLQSGDELKVETTICSEVRNTRQAVFIDHVAQDPAYSGHPTPALYGFQSYISMPIMLKDGTVFGTLCAVDPKPARVSTPETIGMFRLFAELIALHLDAVDWVEVLEQRVVERTAERDLLAEIVGATDVMIMACDPHYTILALNKANADEFERIYGVRPKVGGNVLELLADQPEHQAQVRAGWGRGLSGEQFTLVEDYGDPGRARPYYEVRFRTLWNERGERVGCYQFVTDVTERLREQAALAAAQEALRQSQKMEAVGQLTAGIAHDFNNLLTAVLGSLEMLYKRVPAGDEKAARLLGNAEKGARRGAALIQRLLAFGRSQALRPTAVDVTKLVRGMSGLLGTSVSGIIRIKTRFPISVVLAWVDANQLEMALLNLVVNARDAMPSGGLLTIAAREERVGAKQNSGLSPGDYVVLSVTDTGEGMNPATLARCMEPFFTTKDIGKGTGLGLSMVHGLAAQSKGRLILHSQEGEGTTAELWLPQAETEAAAAEMPVADATDMLAKPLSRRTVLVVDDDSLVRTSTVSMLEDFGHATLEAASGRQALKILRGGVKVDLVLADQAMPSMTGLQLAAELRQVRPGLPVLLASGSPESAELAASGLPLVPKPYGQATVVVAVEECLAEMVPTGRHDIPSGAR